MITFEGLHHISIAVRNLQQAKHFYTVILGFQEIIRPPFSSNGLWYAVGAQQLHLIENPPGETLREGEIDTLDGHFAIQVNSYKETISWLEAAAVSYEARPESIAGFSQIYVLDVDHNIIEFAAAYGS
jgi:catechol 2,3-dioxygenase-like lactoylglutathione lyase family enzyme